MTRTATRSSAFENREIGFGANDRERARIDRRTVSDIVLYCHRRVPQEARRPRQGFPTAAPSDRNWSARTVIANDVVAAIAGDERQRGRVAARATFLASRDVEGGNRRETLLQDIKRRCASRRVSVVALRQAGAPGQTSIARRGSPTSVISPRKRASESTASACPTPLDRKYQGTVRTGVHGLDADALRNTVKSRQFVARTRPNGRPTPTAKARFPREKIPTGGASGAWDCAEGIFAEANPAAA